MKKVRELQVATGRKTAQGGTTLATVATRKTIVLNGSFNAVLELHGAGTPISRTKPLRRRFQEIHSRLEAQMLWVSQLARLLVAERQL